MPDLLFEANLGAGKTTFIKEICHLLQVQDDLSSPTYGIINAYQTLDENDVYHLDCYRLSDPIEAWDIGAHEIIDSGNYCFIEWPEKIYNLLPQNYVRIDILLEGQIRIFNFTKL